MKWTSINLKMCGANHENIHVTCERDVFSVWDLDTDEMIISIECVNGDVEVYVGERVNLAKEILNEYRGIVERNFYERAAALVK